MSFRPTFDRKLVFYALGKSRPNRTAHSGLRSLISFSYLNGRSGSSLYFRVRVAEPNTSNRDLAPRHRKPMNIVGPQVRRLRVQQGLTQPSLAARCQRSGYDLSREGLAKIESRLRGVSDAEVVLLARALRVPFALLYPTAEELETLIMAFFAS